MRLPEPFEYKVACKEASTFGLNNMIGNWEWASNFALPMYNSYNGVSAALMGDSDCSYASWGWVGCSIGKQISGAFRCVK
jgi:formylglycine-generating enzyme required for sulfatase activity